MKENDPKKLLLTLHQNLQILEERKAKQADNAPLSLLNQIDDYKQAIFLTDLVRKGELSFEELVDKLKPLTLDLADGGTTITIQGDEIVYGDKIVVGDVTEGAAAVGERSAAAAKGGIAISGNVGGNLVISMGNTQVVLPRLLQIALVVVTLGVILLVVAQGASFYTASQLTRMTGDFNIAIAQFQVEGQGEGVAAAQELAQGFANSIEGEINELVDKIYASKIEIRPPQETGPIKGKDETERAKNAEELAKAIYANVVIYGTIEVDGSTATIIPAFYVNQSDFYEAEEIVGQYRMGSAIPLEKVDNSRRRSEVVSTIESRFRALTFIINGLSDLAVGEYEDAKSKFKQALEIEAWDSRDVIHVLLGNAALKQNKLDEAEDYYEQAIQENKNYARAYAGLGSVFYLQALGSDQNNGYDKVNLELLNQAIDTYQQAQTSSEQPLLADVPTKASFGLGQAYFVKALKELQSGDSETGRQDLSEAVEAFQKVIEAYGEGTNPRVKELAAHSFARLGLIDRFTKQLEPAISKYTKALELLPDLERTALERARYEAALGDIYIELAQPAEAIKWYQQAVESAPPDSAEKSRYQQKLDELQ